MYYTVDFYAPTVQHLYDQPDCPHMLIENAIQIY